MAADLCDADKKSPFYFTDPVWRFAKLLESYRSASNNRSTRSKRVAKDQDFYTLVEMAALLRVQVSAVRARLGRGDPSLPPSIRVGGRRLFPVSLYEQWRDGLFRSDEEQVEISTSTQRIDRSGAQS
jgi:hypothetical protein